jgi:hypothetical protein
MNQQSVTNDRILMNPKTIIYEALVTHVFELLTQSGK